MDKFARIIVGYHRCGHGFADDILTGTTPIVGWQKSQNTFDWLGHGIYFWEHSPSRAMRWATQQFEKPAVVGAIIQLGTCFDLLDEANAVILGKSYPAFVANFRNRGKPLPVNRGKDHKSRELDCAAINECLDRFEGENIHFDTVRAAFLEGEPVFPGTTISAESHIQIAVRNVDCILGVFRPNL
jgi:hypothetical protein